MTSSRRHTATLVAGGGAGRADGPVPPSLLPTRLRDWQGWLTMAVLLGVTVLSVIRSFGPMTYRGDIWRQSDTATIAHNFFVGGMQLFYPQINWGGSGPGYVETEFQLMPYLAAALYHVFGESPAIGRLVSLAFGLVAVAAFWQLARRLLPGAAARWALIAFLLSPAFMTYASAFMPDMTSLAFGLLALAAFERWLALDRARYLAGAAAGTAMAALVKPTALHLLLILLVWTFVVDRRRLARPWPYLAAVAAVLPAAVWMWHARGLYLDYGNTFGVFSGGDSKLGDFQFWLSPQFYLGNLSIETTLVYGIVGVPPALLGLWQARRSGPVFAFVLAALPALALLYLAVPRYSSELGPHYHLFSLPVAAMLVGLGVAALGEWARRWAARSRQPWLAARSGRWLHGAAAAASVLAVAALAAPSVAVFDESMQDRSGAFGSCARALDAVSAPGELSVVATSSLAQVDGVPNNFQEPVIFYLANRRGWVLPADGQDPRALEAFAEQGARFFVVPDRSLVPAGSELAAYLGQQTKVRSFAADGCAVWALRPLSPTSLPG